MSSVIEIVSPFLISLPDSEPDLEPGPESALNPINQIATTHDGANHVYDVCVDIRDASTVSTVSDVSPFVASLSSICNKFRIGRFGH